MDIYIYREREREKENADIERILRKDVQHQINITKLAFMLVCVCVSVSVVWSLDADLSGLMDRCWQTLLFLACN